METVSILSFRFLRSLACILFVFFAFQPVASSAAADLGGDAYRSFNGRFWFGTPDKGHYGVINGNDMAAVVSGPSEETAAQRGWLWQYAQAWNVTYAYWKISGSPDAQTRLKAVWSWVRAGWSPSAIAKCGDTGKQTHTAMDDSTWDAMGLVQLYDATGDPEALRYAATTIDCAYARWHSEIAGGGLQYKDGQCDAASCKNSYNGQFALAMIECYQRGCASEQISNSEMYLKAKAIADWANTNLLRASGAACPQNDNLYWMGVYSKDGVITPIENACSSASQIAPAGSVTQLSNNMAFAALNARLYAITREPNYKRLAIGTAKSILELEVDHNGAFLDDRDIRTNGFAAWSFAADVVPILPFRDEVVATYRATARCVMDNDRTEDGAFGGDWCGPLKGKWSSSGFGAYQLENSANAAIWPIVSMMWSRE